MTLQPPVENRHHRARTSYAAFAVSIERLCRADPGARAQLRAGLRRDLDHPRARAMHRLLTPRLPEGCDDKTAQAHYTVASLIAAQPRHAFAADQEQAEDEDTALEQEAPQDQAGQHDAEPDEQDASPDPTPYGPSFGAALGHAVMAKNASMRLSAAESRINLLTRQTPRGLHLHLPAAVNQVRTAGATIDWGQLLADLVDWPHRSGRISRRWLQDFYRITARADRD